LTNLVKLSAAQRAAAVEQFVPGGGEGPIAPDHAVRAPLLAFVDRIAAYDEIENDYDEDVHSDIVMPLFEIAEYFEAEGERKLAAHLYWTIERHGVRWDAAERALAARKRLTT